MLSIKQILKLYKSGFKSAREIKFSSVEKQDVYNITAPFKFGRSTYILGRVESRDIEESAKVMFFKKKSGSRYWVPDKTCPDFVLQDPALVKIGDMYVLSGVEIARRKGKEWLFFRTVFYKGSDIHNLRQFTHGPWGMKSIRLIELPDGKIGIFTRPRWKKGGRGRIGFTVIDSLQKLTPRVLSQADVLKGQFARGEWGGVNDALILKNGNIGVIGHIARYTKGQTMRFYYPMAFCFNPKTREHSTLRLLVRRAELPEGEAKRPDLYNVVYPGGIIREKGGLAKLYVGVGDAEAYEVIIQDPFVYYEENNICCIEKRKAERKKVKFVRRIKKRKKN